MKVGFLNNQIDNRGTGNAMFDYAHYNEEILGNESLIYTFYKGAHDKLASARYIERFGTIALAEEIRVDKPDVLYHITSGKRDGNTQSYSPYCVHSVFDNEPHGDRYATISKWMGERYSLPFVPHIINLPNVSDSIRDQIGIPKDAIVFGRHGGVDTFDIPWVWEVIELITRERKDIWFLFLNTAIPDMDLENRNVIFISPTANPYQKKAFINTCDAMLHARARGETFGIAVGEFAISGKPVITCADSGEQAHIQELGEHGLYYQDFRSLYMILDSFVPYDTPPLYSDYTPKKVMAKFKEVFLDDFSKRG